MFTSVSLAWVSGKGGVVVDRQIELHGALSLPAQQVHCLRADDLLSKLMKHQDRDSGKQPEGRDSSSTRGPPCPPQGVPRERMGSFSPETVRAARQWDDTANVLTFKYCDLGTLDPAKLSFRSKLRHLHV